MKRLTAKEKAMITKAIELIETKATNFSCNAISKSTGEGETRETASLRARYTNFYEMDNEGGMWGDLGLELDHEFRRFLMLELFLVAAGDV